MKLRNYAAFGHYSILTAGQIVEKEDPQLEVEKTDRNCSIKVCAECSSKVSGKIVRLAVPNHRSILWPGRLSVLALVDYERFQVRGGVFWLALKLKHCLLSYLIKERQVKLENNVVEPHKQMQETFQIPGAGLYKLESTAIVEPLAFVAKIMSLQMATHLQVMNVVIWAFQMVNRFHRELQLL